MAYKSNNLSALAYAKGSMPAYRSDPAVKAGIMAQLAEHRAADEIIKGTYWYDGKGCAVGCGLESWRKVQGLAEIAHSDHALYDDILGTGGQMLARLEDAIFEALPNGAAKAWPERFMGAIRPGADLSRVGWQFLHWLLTDSTVNPGIDDPSVRNTVNWCADVLVPLTKGEPVDVEAVESAWSAAWSATSAAASAAASASWSARSAAESARSAVGSAANAAESARSAAGSARSAVESAWSAAWSAASAAESTAASAAGSAAWSARSARSAAWVRMSDKLIELLEAA